jgi:acetylornithine deacetylase/succinyl-diaminopimelate desuccinylase-like protein
VDIKGPLAAQVYAVAALARAGLRPRRDVLVVAVTDEEVGGKGAAHLVRHLPVSVPDGSRVQVGACVVGEPSSNRVMLGHRGVARATVSFHGRAHHASLGLSRENPHFAMARFVARLEALELPSHPVLGASTIAPTLVHADTASANLTPNRIDLTLDWRTTSETGAGMRETLTALTADLGATFVSFEEWQSGPEGLNTPGFVTGPDAPLAVALQRALHEADPGAPEPGVWRFATDGRYTHAAGIPTVGFGPGDENLAHTTRESIEVSALEFHAAVLARFVINEVPPA